MRVELLCLDVDGTLTDGSLIYGFTNSASCGDFLGSASARFVNEPKSSISSLASHKRENSSTILEFASCKNAESTTNSAESSHFCHSNSLFCHSERSEESKKNPSLRADSQNLRGNPQGFARAVARSNHPPIEKSVELQNGLPRSHSLARNDENLDSSLRVRSAQNDKIGAENNNFDTRVAESRLDSALPKQGANSAIADEFLGFCETSDEDRTLVHRGSELKQSLKSRCESKFAEILKVFNAKDGLALAYWTKSLNRKVAIITGKKSEILRHRARELGINLLFMGVSDKGAVVRDLKKDLGLDSTQIACVGDDLNDISMFAESSLNFAPRDCASHLKTLPNIEILRCKGGRGAVREAIETILQKEGIYEDFISVFAR